MCLHRCKTLEASADGYVRAEAVGCALLVPAAEVPEGLLQGLALLAGSAVNQDGRSSSLTAPNGPSQQGVIRQALQDGGVAGAEVAVVQMHGTGTPLGGKPPLPPPLPTPSWSQSHFLPSVITLYLMCNGSAVCTYDSAVQLMTSWIGPGKPYGLS